MTVKDRLSSFQTGAQLMSASPQAEWSRRRAGPVPPVQTWTRFPEIVRSMGFMASLIEGRKIPLNDDTIKSEPWQGFRWRFLQLRNEGSIRIKGKAQSIFRRQIKLVVFQRRFL